MNRTTLAASAAALTLIFVPPAHSMVVYDPTNYAQNVMQAARALEQVKNQITSLQNEAQMLINQAKNLQRLDVSSLAVIDQNMARVQGLLGQAQRIAYDVQAIESAFQSGYAAPAAGATDVQMVEQARARWANSVAAFKDAMQVQAGVVQNLPQARAEAAKLVGASQGASGVLAATQAGNQLLALQTQQLGDLSALLAAQGRAQALEEARRTAAEAEARERRRRFLGGEGAYTPQPVDLFPGR